MGRRDASGTVYSYVTDPLRTTKGIISSTLCYDADFYPFGGEKVFTNTCAQNYKFTGLERDAESGLDETLNLACIAPGVLRHNLRRNNNKGARSRNDG